MSSWWLEIGHGGSVYTWKEVNTKNQGVLRKGAEGVRKERRRKGGRERETHVRKRTSYQTFAKIPLLKEEHFQVRITELFGPFFPSILLPPNVLCDKASHKEEQTPWKMVPASGLGMDFTAQSQLQCPVQPDTAFPLQPLYTPLMLQVIGRASRHI